jgi:hypothetical protein
LQHMPRAQHFPLQHVKPFLQHVAPQRNSPDGHLMNSGACAPPAGTPRPREALPKPK